ncbi:hypothetical protein ACFSTC_07240 [Nonomuraea ferruginea]
MTFPGVPLELAYPAWIAAGFGMGLIYPTLSVLTLELSAPGEAGENSGALHLGESVFSVVAVAVTSALFIAVGGAYWTVFTATLVIAAAGLLIVPRAVRAGTPVPATAAV